MNRPARTSPLRDWRARLAWALLPTLTAAVPASAAEFGDPILLGSLDPTVDRGFGRAVAIDGDTLAVGSPWSPEGGVVYVYERQASAEEPWRLTAMLTGKGSELREGFGRSLALEGDTLVVGAPHEDSRGDTAGAVYVFYRDRGGRGNWGRVRTLVPRNLDDYFYYGSSVAIDGDRIAVGAEEGNRVYIHERNHPVPSWWGVRAEIQGRLTAPAVLEHFSRFYKRGDVAPGFGAEVELSGNILAVGAVTGYTKYSDDIIHSESFGLFLFEREDGVWKQRRHYAPPALRREDKVDLFSLTMGLDGSVLLAGDGRSLDTGCYVFQRDSAGRDRWGRQRELHDFSGEFGRGIAVDVRGNVAAITGYFSGDEQLENGHGALVYQRHAPARDGWGPIARLRGSAVTESAWSVAIGPREIVLGHSYPGVVQIFPRRPLVADDFESGEIAGFSRHTGNLEVISPGLAGTDHALAVQVDGTQKVSLVRARQPMREPRLSLSFQLAANRVGLGGARVEVMTFYGPSRDLVRLTLEADRVYDQYWLRLWAWERIGQWREVGKARMPPKRGVRVEVEWRAAANRGSYDGVAKLWLDRRLRAAAGNLNTDRFVVNGMLLGLPKGSKGTTRGEILLDQVELRP